MNPPSADAPRPLLEVHGARASSVIVQRIAPEHAETFLQWQRGITAAAGGFAGYQTTEVYPPTNPLEEWVVVIHFDSTKALQDWLGSPVRAGLMANLPAEFRDFKLMTLPSSFGAWFADRDENDTHLPHWKMFLTVLFGLYPTVMLLNYFLGPHIQRFGLAVAMLIGNAASVSFLEWLGMPVISRFLSPWLRANARESRALSIGGLFVLLGALALMTFLFSLVPAPR